MDLVYPVVLYVGIAIILLFSIIKLKNKKTNYKDGRKIANTEYIKNTPYYKKIVKRYKILIYVAEICCSVAGLAAVFLMARIANITKTSPELRNRDIFLCMDVSTSVTDLDEDLVSRMKKLVKSMEGERFGITIFNTSSSLLVPLTDDYEYVENVLDKLEDGLSVYNDFYNNPNSNYFDDKNLSEKLNKKNFVEAGTLVGNEDRGSSIIGDGLASCIFDFPNIEEKRTRIIIFSTDNEDASKNGPIVSLLDASEIAKDRGIIIYGICPPLTKAKDEKELRRTVENTGGKLYNSGDSKTVSEIVNEIEKTESSKIKGVKETIITDKPEIPLIALTVIILILFIICRKVKI